jgi:hypothetical protein
MAISLPWQDKLGLLVAPLVVVHRRQLLTPPQGFFSPAEVEEVEGTMGPVGV